MFIVRGLGKVGGVCNVAEVGKIGAVCDVAEVGKVGGVCNVAEVSKIGSGKLINYRAVSHGIYITCVPYCLSCIWSVLKFHEK